jgi:hypothetical protein
LHRFEEVFIFPKILAGLAPGHKIRRRTFIRFFDVLEIKKPFRIIIQGNGGTLEQVYAKVQFLLRQSTDINTSGTAGVKLGAIQSDLLTFVGDTLATAQGVYIDGVLAADSNRVEFFDQNNVKRTNPYTAAGTITFNAPLVGAGSSYRLMFSAPPGAGNDYGESGAITVNDAVSRRGRIKMADNSNNTQILQNSTNLQASCYTQERAQKLAGSIHQ